MSMLLYSCKITKFLKNIMMYIELWHGMILSPSIKVGGPKPIQDSYNVCLFWLYHFIIETKFGQHFPIVLQSMNFEDKPNIWLSSPKSNSKNIWEILTSIWPNINNDFVAKQSNTIRVPNCPIRTIQRFIHVINFLQQFTYTHYY